MPVLSVITINYNNKQGLEDTVLSVLSQTSKAFEFIVIDGGSRDGSLEIIDAHKNEITYFVSEKDNGIYDAQNKGIQKAMGEYLLFLNSGDTFYKNTVVSEFYQFIANKEQGIVYGNSNLVFSAKSDEVLYPPQKLDNAYFFEHTINHQACFIKKEVFLKFGMYDTAYKICADFDLFFKVFVKAPETYIYFNTIICNYKDGGLSSDKKNFELVVSEKKDILKKLLPAKEYERLYADYRNKIPLKYRILEHVYKIPVLSWLFKKTLSAIKGNGN